MKVKHLRQRVQSCIELAELSSCTRRRFGCVILDPESNVVISDGYNGSMRGCGELCGGTSCDREVQQLKSGSSLEIGCVHAEQNAIYNAARRGISVKGGWLFVNGEPCMLCAKAIAQVGITRVFCIGGGYSTTAGVELLEKSGIITHTIAKDADDAVYEVILNTVSQPARQPQPARRSPFTR